MKVGFSETDDRVDRMLNPQVCFSIGGPELEDQECPMFLPYDNPQSSVCRNGRFHLHLDYTQFRGYLLHI